MKNKFKATYFDGKTSKANSCTIVFENSQWKIIPLDNSFTDVVWQIDKIQKPEVYTSGFYSYTYGEIPKQVIEINNLEFEKALLLHYPKYDLTRKNDSFLINNKLKSIVFLSLTFISIALLSYFVVIPSLSHSFAKKLPTETVIELGDFFYSSLEHEIDENVELSILMQDFANDIELESEFDMKITVSDKDIMNAFAMPGGRVVIYRGLLEKIENENQLLALLGHEFTHTNNRHVLKNLIKNLSGYFVISLFIGDANGILSILLENAHMLNQLSFTRELEKEADIEGIDIIEQNQADPNGMHELFSIMNEGKDSIHYIVQYLSTHPEMEQRIKYTKELASNKKTNTNMEFRRKWMLIKNELYK